MSDSMFSRNHSTKFCCFCIYFIHKDCNLFLKFCFFHVIAACIDM